MSSSSQVTLSITDGREHGQLNKDSEDALHHRSQRTNYSPGDTERLSQNNTSTSLPHDGLSSLYKDVNSLIVEVTSGPFEEEGFAASPPDEDTVSPVEMAEIKSPRFSFVRVEQLRSEFPSLQSPKSLETSTHSAWKSVLMALPHWGEEVSGL